MNSGVFKRILAAAIGLPALSGAAWAGGSDDLGCSKATLQGAYAFSVLSVASATGPGVVVGLGTFDGKGGLTQIDYPWGRAGRALNDSPLNRLSNGSDRYLYGQSELHRLPRD
jgi:hypothetical protein